MQYCIMLRVAYIEDSNEKSTHVINKHEFMTGVNQGDLHRSIGCIAIVVFVLFLY